MIEQNVLLITFDFSQRGKSGTGLAAGSLLAACHAHPEFGSTFLIDHIPISMSQPKELTPKDVVSFIRGQCDVCQLSHIALACYVWSSHLVEPLMQLFRTQGFEGKFILGGYEVHGGTCFDKYPTGDAYIVGNAEFTLLEAIFDSNIAGRKIYHDQDRPSDFAILPSPYLANGNLYSAIPLKQGQQMVHWETKRGCNFKCNFCQHRDLSGVSVRSFDLERIKSELDQFKAKDVKKINVLDPIFNNPSDNHLEILKYCIGIRLSSELNLQVRFEFITEEFLKLCRQLNVSLEFGLQTVVPSEFKVIDRPNNLKVISQKIELLKTYEIPFLVSLIYGLPLQTVDSFNESIRFLKDQCVKDVVAYPLMLLEGTKLKNESKKWLLVEKVIDDSLIPHVVSSSSFNEREYHEMRNISLSLSNRDMDGIA
ncbi:B12-binding domain-containing radical SAM protein [Reinekea thalattae]|uniref:Radical SAM protein n=1 Tax=Reinekea thalattae TaxID=2593301 RepID=A0A5C8ZBG8_9GAMM|nr:radical SAM protein [Reinekea thalattae]TXR54538.1 radical SAM protein [Reinekea thalattae]